MAHSEGAAGWSSHKRLPAGATTYRPVQQNPARASSDVVAAGFVPEKADPKAKSKALQGRVQKGAGGTFTDQLPPAARQLTKRSLNFALYCRMFAVIREVVLVVGA